VHHSKIGRQVQRWVIRYRCDPRRWPVYARFTPNSDQTFAPQRTVAKCQKQTHAAQQNASLFEHLVGEREDVRRYVETECLGSGGEIERAVAAFARAAASYHGVLMSKERVAPNPIVTWSGEPRCVTSGEPAGSPLSRSYSTKTCVAHCGVHR